MQVYKGIAGTPGVVIGPLVRLDRGFGAQNRMIQTPEEEWENLQRALASATAQLEQLASQASESESEIFLFQRILLEDEGLLGEIRAYVEAGAGAAAAVERASQLYSTRISAIPDEYIQQRSADVMDACRRVVDILDGRPSKHVVLTQPSILVSDLFYPSDVLSFNKGMVLGFITSKGSVQSHAAIIARSMGLPTVVQAGRGILTHENGTTCILDADNATVVVNPLPETIQMVQTRVRLAQELARREDPERMTPCVTQDGASISVLANCTGPNTISEALRYGAEGVGLLRTEGLLREGKLPSEEEQFYFYVSCLTAAEGKPVTVRTFDFIMDELDSSSRTEDNPVIGMRGIRLMLSRPRLFQNQLCALMRAALYGELRVVLPMVSSLQDWEQCMAIVERSREDLRRRGVRFREDLPIGLMVEVPGAALECGDIVEAGAGLLVIGTNDLVQYTCAATRYDPVMERYYNPTTKGVCRLIEMVLKVAAEKQVPCSLVGLAPTNPAVAELYVRMGVRTLGMAAPSIPVIKQHLRGIRL